MSNKRPPTDDEIQFHRKFSAPLRVDRCKAEKLELLDKVSTMILRYEWRIPTVTYSMIFREIDKLKSEIENE